MFRKFEKIHRLGKPEVAGILEGTCVIQEKIDGANTSVWLKDGIMQLASRNQMITGGFNGFVEHMEQHYEVKKLLEDYPHFRLYGEWLVPHTVSYDEFNYKQWFIYDIYDHIKEEFLDPLMVDSFAEIYRICMPWSLVKETPSLEYLQSLVGKSELGPLGEGIVIKNHNFKNQWGERCYAKLVRQEFLEDNAIKFNGNNKFADNYNELYIINKYMTAARVQKICNKLQPEIDEKLDMKHIPRITNTAYHDMITEEAWEIAQLKKVVDYKILQGLALKKAKVHFVESLEQALKDAHD